MINIDSNLNQFDRLRSYLFHDKEKPGFELMPYTIECTKSGIGTKLFWVLAAEGEQGIANYIDRQFNVTKEFYKLISEHPENFNQFLAVRTFS